MENQLEKIRQIKRKNEKTWLALDAVVAVGVGLLSSGKPGILISVKVSPEQLASKIPKSIEGVPVEVRYSGEISAF